jgi:hypothetical protein
VSNKYFLITRSDSSEIEKSKLVMNREFEMTNLGKLSYFLGMKFVKTGRVFLVVRRK